MSMKPGKGCLQLTIERVIILPYSEIRLTVMTTVAIFLFVCVVVVGWGGGGEVSR